MSRTKNINVRGLKITNLNGTLISEEVVAKSLNQTQSDVVRGDFKSPYPYTRTSTYVEYDHGVRKTVNAYDPPVVISVSGPLTATPFSGDLSGMSSAIYLARVKAENALTENIRGSIDLSESVATAGQTSKMLNLVGRFTTAVTQMRRTYLRQVWREFSARNRNDKSFRRALVRWQKGYALNNPKIYTRKRVDRGVAERTSALAANGWLEFTYGLKPLCYDIYGIANNLYGFVRNTMKRYSALGKEVWHSTYRDVEGTEQFPRLVDVKITAVTRFGVSMDSSFDPGISKWTNLNPLSLAYALTPGSFVLDWFLDIGGYMRNVETMALYAKRFLTGYETSFVKAQVSSKTFGTAVFGITTYTKSSSSYYETISMSRSIMGSYPWPSLPKFSVNMGSSRMISAAALLRGLIR